MFPLIIEYYTTCSTLHILTIHTHTHIYQCWLLCDWCCSNKPALLCRFPDAHWKGSFCRLPGRKALLPWRAVRQRQVQLHHGPRQTRRQRGKHKLLSTTSVWSWTDNPLFPGRPRLCVTWVSQEVQTSCWRVGRGRLLQSVGRRCVDHHRTAIFTTAGAQHSYNTWRGEIQREEVEPSLTASHH